MPGKRISELTALSGAASANNDDLLIFDSGAGETKRISRSQLAEGMVPDLPLQYYLGVLNANPTQRLNGDALQIGDFYLDAVTKYTTVYNGSGWNSYASVIAAQAAAEAARDKAQEWATNPEDTPVETGQFSALHWSAKAGDEKLAAQAARTGAETAETNAETAEAGAVAARLAAEAAQTGAELAETNAETARDAAFVNADVYADTAAGLAGTTLGDQFQVVEGQWLVRYSHDAGPVATEVARLLISVSPSYSNASGAGNRTASVAVTVSGTSLTTNAPSNLVDGAFANNTTDSIAFVPGAAAAGEWIQFDFGLGAERVITEAKWYQANTATHGTWKWQGSGDGSTWTDIGVGFTLGGATTQVQTELKTNGTAYRFYRLLGVSGNVSGSPYIQEVEFKIAAQVTEGFQRIESRFPDYFPTAKLAAAYFFDEGTDTEVPDVLGAYPIDLTLPTNPNVTRTGYGLKTELGLIQTPVLPNVRGQLVLYRTNKDGATGFIVSGGPGGSGDGTLQQNDAVVGVDQTKMLGFGLDPFQPPAVRDDNSGAACWALNRGGWAGYYRQTSSAASSAFGLGGRHSTTTSRCAEFETNCAFFFNDTLTDDEINAVYRFLRQRAKQFGIYLHREDAPETTDLYMIFGESNADGRSTLSNLSAADQAADMRHTVISASNAGSAMVSLDRFELGFNQQASDPTNDFGPEFGIAAQRRANFLLSPFAARTTGRALIAKVGKGSTYIAPSANGIPVGAAVSWNASELESGGLFYLAFRQLYFTLQQALEQGIGFGDTVRVGMWIGLNDAVSTSYVVDAATYQSYLQDWLDTLESYLPGLTLEVLIFRPHTSDPASNPTAIADVRTAIDAFAAANANVTSVDTDAYGLEADNVHYDAAASKAMGVTLHG